MPSENPAIYLPSMGDGRRLCSNPWLLRQQDPSGQRQGVPLLSSSLYIIFPRTPSGSIHQRQERKAPRRSTQCRRDPKDERQCHSPPGAYIGSEEGGLYTFQHETHTLPGPAIPFHTGRVHRFVQFRRCAHEDGFEQTELAINGRHQRSTACVSRR